jgi:hypothetical protein
MKNVDIDLIKKGISKFSYRPPKSEWGKYLKKTSSYDPNELIEVRTKKRLWDLETDIHHNRNAVIKIKKSRAAYLESKDYVEVL